ncbi:MAG: ABC transporter ATP-binding protein [Desulfobulbaceae bacterium]|nr:ABC transporter ATP-binding protein [Desulfobulbaceae bacterium]
MEKSIQLVNLSKSYDEGSGKHQVFSGLNHQFKVGEITVMFGRSGSGKSTLLNLISGIDVPDSGSIIIDNENISELNEHKRTIFRRNHIGFIFQFFNLIPTLTLLENLLLLMELKGKLSGYDIENAKKMLVEVGLGGKDAKYPDMLSGGEQQRVAIARALIHNPDIILADEPTGNLDKHTGASIIELLDRLVKQKNKTMIMATHSKELIGLADNILSVEGGGLVSISKEDI